ncbi:MAG TPA: SUMF1/EgtB/PvdO family nonheme iron enzyme, partial [Candidatus Dormibacteraeota bacterium]|nr:SUMF1/EgtB/PvdO family nonheme iron enzyme [Candidatus Dormibacteraeota bacterium]
KYFFKTAKPKNEALKRDSPLAETIKLQRAKVYLGGGFGDSIPFKHGSTKEVTFGIQVPETVKRGELEIGRFEVTKAQFAQYQTLSCTAKAGKADNSQCVEYQKIVALMQDFPESNVKLEDAKAYVAWLSMLTNATWRLPYEDEVKDLYANREGENTLDYWAGYAINPEDATRLREKAKEIITAARLLKEVGSFRGQGEEDEEPIYDLGGNVAEWVLTRDGKGKVTGGSADCPADPKSNCTPAPEYIGFRVVRGAPKPAPAPTAAH